MPTRLYYWLVLAGTTTAIGVALMAKHLDVLALAAFTVAFILVLTGGIAELLVPFLIWRFEHFGKCDRAIQARIKLGETLLKQPVATQDECTHWDALTQKVLRKYLGGEWHPELRRFASSDVGQSVEEHRRVLVAQKLHQLIAVRKALENREIIVILD
jgi:hypothetical protein